MYYAILFNTEHQFVDKVELCADLADSIEKCCVFAAQLGRELTIEEEYEIESNFYFNFNSSITYFVGIVE